MFELIDDEGRSAQTSAALRVYNELRAELGAGDDPRLMVEVMRAGGHLWLALVDDDRSDAVDCVAADLAALAERTRDAKVGRAWATAFDATAKRLPLAPRRALLARSERLIATFGAPFAAALLHTHGETLSHPELGPDALREELATLSRMAGESVTRRSMSARVLADVARSLGWQAEANADALVSLRVVIAAIEAIEALNAPGAAEALEQARRVLPEVAAAEREERSAAALAARERDPEVQAIEGALVAAGHTPPAGPVPEGALAGPPAWTPLARRGWLLHFDAETGFAPHTEHGALLRRIAARLGRELTIDEDAFVEGAGWRLVFTTSERHSLTAGPAELDDWIDLDLLFQATAIVAGDAPVYTLPTGDQTVTLLLAPPSAARSLEAAGALRRLKARRVAPATTRRRRSSR